MTDRPMTREELERLGALLFGHAWKSQMADALDINRKTVSRWIADGEVPSWAADRLRAMVSIAPPPGTSSDDDRDDACQDVLEPELSRIVAMAESAGWHRGEIITAFLALTIADMRQGAGDEVTIGMLNQAIAAIRAA